MGYFHLKPIYTTYAQECLFTIGYPSGIRNQIRSALCLCNECAGSILCRCRCGSYAGKMAKLGISLQNLTQYSEGCTEMYNLRLSMFSLQRIHLLRSYVLCD